MDNSKIGLLDFRINKILLKSAAVVFNFHAQKSVPPLFLKKAQA